METQELKALQEIGNLKVTEEGYYSVKFENGFSVLFDEGSNENRGLWTLIELWKDNKLIIPFWEYKTKWFTGEKLVKGLTMLSNK